MRVLLTGSAGFIGGAVGAALEARGDEVLGVDLMLDQAHHGAAAPADTQNLDVRDAGEWVDLLKGVDVVCHQAALVGAGVRVADLPHYAAHNDLGTAALLAAMHEARVDRMVLASSMVVYGEGRYSCAEHGTQVPSARTREALDSGRFDNYCRECGRALDWQLIDEDARLDPRSAYAASKLAQEHYASSWARQADGAVVALRYHNVYGPRMPKDTPYSGVAAMFRSSIERAEPPRVFEDGAQMRDFVHVDDVARANLVAIDAVVGGPGGWLRAFNVCSGTPVSIQQVADLVAEGTGTGIVPRVTGEYRAGDVRHVVASPERARAELGFTAQVLPEQGLPAFATAPLRG